MPTVFTHPIPAIALSTALGKEIISIRLALAAIVCSVLPDLDVAAYWFHFSGGLQAHRGFSHSLAAAALIGCCGFLLGPWLHSGRKLAFAVLFCATASHGLLDAITTGGSGVAFFWPFDEIRYFLPWRPVLVSPIRPESFFSERGLRVIFSEMRWIWLPCLTFALAAIVTRSWLRTRR